MLRTKGVGNASVLWSVCEQLNHRRNGGSSSGSGSREEPQVYDLADYRRVRSSTVKHQTVSQLGQRRRVL
jgi:hypothetical protein